MSLGYQLVNDDGSITVQSIIGLNKPFIGVQEFVSPIDATAAGSTLFPAVATGLIFTFSELRIGFAAGITGFVSVGIIKLGIDGGSGNELITTTTLTGLNDNGLEIVLRPTVYQKPVAGEQVSLNITTPFVATTCSLYAVLCGFYTPA